MPRVVTTGIHKSIVRRVVAPFAWGRSCGLLWSVRMHGKLYNILMRSKSFDGLMRAAAAIVVLTAAMSLRIAAAENSQDEYARIADWRAKRLASLTGETGWLTPIALYWLKDGENSFGRASDRAFSRG